MGYASVCRLEKNCFFSNYQDWIDVRQGRLKDAEFIYASRKLTNYQKLVVKYKVERKFQEKRSLGLLE
ncbi:MAG: hypothetical protein DRQ02_00955 [Candidatus Latescibacterota bacterium]|nr:MAG: hypothetical protein DRQ02_00955 [Candidatus Latescibacterota bacterium]